MSVLWCFIWGIMTFSIMTLTIKYYLPELKKRAFKMNSEAHAVISEEVKEKVEEYPVVVKIMIGLCVLFSMVCGYEGFSHCVSMTGLCKMTLAFGVLSCIFITDMYLMLIPNLCCLILLGGRAVLIIPELIWNREFVVQWLINSMIAMVVSVLLLLVMSKITQGGLGMGDVKLFGSLGFLCGIRAVFFTLAIGFFLCAVISTIFLITRRKQLKDSLPLGPFIWTGYGISVLLSVI